MAGTQATVGQNGQRHPAYTDEQNHESECKHHDKSLNRVDRSVDDLWKSDD